MHHLTFQTFKTFQNIIPRERVLRPLFPQPGHIKEKNTKKNNLSTVLAIAGQIQKNKKIKQTINMEYWYWLVTQKNTR